MGDGQPRRREFSRTMVVDDETDWRARVITLLEPIVTGEIRGVGTVAEARRVLDEWRPDLLVLDYELSDGNAYNVLGAVRRLAHYHPAILIISQGKARDREAFYLPHQGAREYLSKPFTSDDLREKVERCRQPRDLAPVLEDNLGLLSLPEALRTTRMVMVRAALGLTTKQKLGAALLGISPQMMNYFRRTLFRRKKKPRT